MALNLFLGEEKGEIITAAAVSTPPDRPAGHLTASGGGA